MPSTWPLTRLGRSCAPTSSTKVIRDTCGVSWRGSRQLPVTWPGMRENDERICGEEISRKKCGEQIQEKCGSTRQELDEDVPSNMWCYRCSLEATAISQVRQHWQLTCTTCPNVAAFPGDYMNTWQWIITLQAASMVFDNAPADGSQWNTYAINCSCAVCIMYAHNLNTARHTNIPGIQRVYTPLYISNMLAVVYMYV